MSLEEFNDFMRSVYHGNFDQIIKRLKDNPSMEILCHDKQFFRELWVHRRGLVETRRIWDFLIRNEYLVSLTKYGYDIVFPLNRRVMLESKL